MFGPKLDARSYAILILVVIAALIGGNLVAQTKSTSESTAELAAATQQVASATQQVAQANADIAAAIRELASAVREVPREGGSSGSSSSSSTESTSAETSNDEIRISPDSTVVEKTDGTDGVFKLKD